MKLPPVSALCCCELVLSCLAAEQDTWQPQEYWGTWIYPFNCCQIVVDRHRLGCMLYTCCFHRGLPERSRQITIHIWLKLRLSQSMKKSIFSGTVRRAWQNISGLFKKDSEYASIDKATSKTEEAYILERKQSSNRRTTLVGMFPKHDLEQNSVENEEENYRVAVPGLLDTSGI